MDKNYDHMAIYSRNYVVNNERVFYSSNVTKFSDTGYRYDTALIITDQAIYNFYRSSIKRRTPLDRIEALTVSSKGSEFVIHIDKEHDYRFHSQDLRKEIVETLIYVLCVVKGYFKELKIYTVDLLNLNAVATDKNRAAQKIKVRPKEIFAKYWNPETWAEQEQATSNQRMVRRRNTQTLFVNPMKTLLQKEICLEDFEVLKVIGKGAFGKVVLAQKKDNLTYYAIKMLKKKQIVDSNMVEKTLAEKTILQKMQHPFLVGLEYAFQTDTKLYFVLEFMPGGELFTHLRREGRFNEARAKFYAVCIILGLGFLHDNSYVYRDLKMENVLLDKAGYAVITDFGFAKLLRQNEQTKTFCGTPDYVAPEILNNSGHDRMADWWSLGILIYEMIYGQTTFYSDNLQIMYSSIKTKQVTFPTMVNTSPDVKSLILGLLNKDPRQRLGHSGDSREILGHPWFFDIDPKLVLEKKIIPPFQPDLRSLENNFDQQQLNDTVRDSLESGSIADRTKLRSYERDFEMMNFNKDAIDNKLGTPRNQ